MYNFHTGLNHQNLFRGFLINDKHMVYEYVRDTVTIANWVKPVIESLNLPANWVPFPISCDQNDLWYAHQYFSELVMSVSDLFKKVIRRLIDVIYYLHTHQKCILWFDMYKECFEKV